MPSQTFFSNGTFIIPQYTGVIAVVVTAGQTGADGFNSAFTNSPVCDVPFGGVNGVSPPGAGGTSAFDNKSVGSDSTQTFNFGQLYYRAGMSIAVVVGLGGTGGVGFETGCGGSTTGAAGANGSVVITWAVLPYTTATRLLTQETPPAFALPPQTGGQHVPSVITRVRVIST